MAEDRCRHCGKVVQRGRSSRQLIICHECRRDDPELGRDGTAYLECVECGTDVIRTDIWRCMPSRTFCSISCSNTFWGRRRRPIGLRDLDIDPDAYRRTVKRSRRAAHEMTWDGVPDAEIFERDGWRCKVSGCLFQSRTIPRNVKFPDPRFGTVDHVVPLSRGGDDTAANKRAAHFRCNSSRGNRTDVEQLHLFGTVHHVPVLVMAGTKRRQLRKCRGCAVELAPEGTRTFCDGCRQQRAAPKPYRMIDCVCRWCGDEFQARYVANRPAWTCPKCHNCSGCGKHVTVVAKSAPPDKRLCHACRGYSQNVA